MTEYVNGIVVGVVASLIASLLITVIGVCARERHRLHMMIRTKTEQRKEVRVSAAYLFRIKLGEEYLMIRGGHIPGQYQPVGGVYKRYASSRAELEKLHVTSDNSVGSRETDGDDLRVVLPMRNLLKFLDWFDKGKGREIQVCRELFEELVEPGYLNMDHPWSAEIEYLTSAKRALHYSIHSKMDELLVHDAFELHLSEDEQVYLRTKIADSDGVLVLVSPEAIEVQHFLLNGKSYNIAPTAKLVL